MKGSQVTLKALEIFEVTARTGSLVKAAQEMECSVSSVSHHLKKLEDQLGISLIDHGSRPMRLTAAGTGYLERIGDGLRLLRQAENEARLGTLAEVRSVRIGIVDDFESVIAPELANMLAASMPKARLLLTTLPSHSSLSDLKQRKLDVAIAARPIGQTDTLLEYPLLVDPFVLAVPAAFRGTSEHLFSAASELPFLRYNPDLIIGRHVEAYLQRLKHDLPRRVILDSNQSIMGLIARSRGWAITTPLSFARAHRFQNDVTLRALPGPAFARTLSLYALTDFSGSLAGAVAAFLRQLILAEAVNPALERFPWLEPHMRVLSPDEGAAAPGQD